MQTNRKLYTLKELRRERKNLLQMLEDNPETDTWPAKMLESHRRGILRDLKDVDAEIAERTAGAVKSG